MSTVFLLVGMCFLVQILVFGLEVAFLWFS